MTSDTPERNSETWRERWRRRFIRLSIVLIVIMTVIIVLAATLGDSGEQAATEQPETVEQPETIEQPEPVQPEAAEEEVQEPTVREKIEACLSPWDGNHDGFENQIRPLLNDERSMETHETRFTTVPIGGDRVLIEMVYSAANAYGGRVKTVATGYMNFETCDVSVVTTGLE